MQLGDIQSRFKDLMLDHPDALNAPEEDFAALFESGSIPLPARLKVYRNNIVGSLTDVMLASFPLLEKLVGKDFLEAMARSFILKNPPAQGCLNFYGTGFDDFIAQFEPAKALPYLPDIARLEIAMNQSYYAADQTAMNANDLAGIAGDDLPELCFEFCDHAKIVQSDYPILDIRDFCLQDDDTATLDISRSGQSCLVVRKDLETQLISLNDETLYILLQLQGGASFGMALEKTLEINPNFNIQNFLEMGITYEIFKAH